jgi:hypothetical protein
MPEPDNVVHDGVIFHDGVYYFDGEVWHRWREYEDEFDVADMRYRNSSIHRRPDAVSPDYLTSFTFGPQEQGDPNGDGGVLNRMWKVRVDNKTKTVYVAKSDNSFSGL